MPDTVTEADLKDVPACLHGMLAAGKKALAKRRGQGEEEQRRQEEERREREEALWRSLLAAGQSVVGAEIIRYADYARPEGFIIGLPKWDLVFSVPGLSDFWLSFWSVGSGKWEPRAQDGAGNWYRVRSFAFDYDVQRVAETTPKGAVTLPEALAVAREEYEHKDSLDAGVKADPF